MKSVRCSSCETVLNLPPSFGGGKIQCPNCGKRFRAKATAGDSEKPTSSTTSNPRKRVVADLATADELFNDDILQQVMSDDPVEIKSTDTSSAETAFAIDDVVVPIKRAAFSNKKKVSEELVMATKPAVENEFNATANDVTRKSFGFKSFWTPAIIKGSWWCVVLLSALWFLLLFVFYVGAWLTGESASSSLTGMLPKGLDLQQVMAGQGDPDALNSMLDKLEGGGGGNSTSQLSSFQKISGVLFGLLSFVTMLASLVLSVLWCRVFFETIVAVFEISARLKSIDEKTS